jgi:HEAT repeat protein
MESNPSRDLLSLYIDFLREDSAPMRRVAVWEIGRLADPAGAPHLMHALIEDADWECRHYAVMALANVGGREEAARLRELAAGEYLSPDGRDPAGPLPEGLREHLALDLEHTAQCCAGEIPRPGAAKDAHGEWWRRGEAPTG